MNTHFIYDTVSERDMDMLFANAISTEPSFLKLFLDKAGIDSNGITVESVELSKTDAEFGESDITVIVSDGSHKTGLLIEDKIDAQAMDNQCGRYDFRGQKGIDSHDYEKFHVFIVCPEKYYQADTEAQKYKNCITYEDCLKCIGQSSNMMAGIWAQQIEQAIIKAKKRSDVRIDENMHEFFLKYRQYQDAHFSQLHCVTNEDSNGWWAQYTSDLGKKVYLYHKLSDGEVKLIFSNSKDKKYLMDDVAKWLSDHGINNVTSELAGKSSSLRLVVPKLDVNKRFEDVSKEDLDECFYAIAKLLDYATVIKKTIDLIE